MLRDLQGNEMVVGLGVRGLSLALRNLMTFETALKRVTRIGASKSIDSTADSFERLASAYDRMKSGFTLREPFKGMTPSELNAISNGFIGLGVAGAGAMAVLGKGMVDAAAYMQQMKVAFTQLLGSASEANRFLGEMRQFALETPFQFPDLLSSSQQLLAVGVPLGNIKKYLTNIGDAVASLGRPEMFPNILLQLQQMAAAEKAMGTELRPMSQAGLPVYRMIAESLGVDAETVRNLGRMNVSFTQFMEILDQYLTKKRLAGMMTAQMTTFKGQVSNLKDAMFFLNVELGEKFLPAIQNVVEATFRGIQWFRELGDVWQNLFLRLGVGIPLLNVAIGLYIKYSQALKLMRAGFHAHAASQAAANAATKEGASGDSIATVTLGRRATATAALTAQVALLTQALIAQAAASGVAVAGGAANPGVAVVGGGSWQARPSGVVVPAFSSSARNQATAAAAAGASVGATYVARRLGGVALGAEAVGLGITAGQVASGIARRTGAYGRDASGRFARYTPLQMAVTSEEVQRELVQQRRAQIASGTAAARAAAAERAAEHAHALRQNARYPYGGASGAARAAAERAAEHAHALRQNAIYDRLYGGASAAAGGAAARGVWGRIGAGASGVGGRIAGVAGRALGPGMMGASIGGMIAGTPGALVMGGAGLGLRFGPWGALIGAAAGGVAAGIMALVKKQRAERAKVAEAQSRTMTTDLSGIDLSDPKYRAVNVPPPTEGSSALQYMQWQRQQRAEDVRTRSDVQAGLDRDKRASVADARAKTNQKNKSEMTGAYMPGIGELDWYGYERMQKLGFIKDPHGETIPSKMKPYRASPLMRTNKEERYDPTRYRIAIDKYGEFQLDDQGYREVLAKEAADKTADEKKAAGVAADSDIEILETGIEEAQAKGASPKDVLRLTEQWAELVKPRAEELKRAGKVVEGLTMSTAMAYKLRQAQEAVVAEEKKKIEESSQRALDSAEWYIQLGEMEEANATEMNRRELLLADLLGGQAEAARASGDFDKADALSRDARKATYTAANNLKARLREESDKLEAEIMFGAEGTMLAIDRVEAVGGAGASVEERRMRAESYADTAAKRRADYNSPYTKLLTTREQQEKQRRVYAADTDAIRERKAHADALIEEKVAGLEKPVAVKRRDLELANIWGESNPEGLKKANAALVNATESQAASLLKLSQETTDPEQKEKLLGMAQVAFIEKERLKQTDKSNGMDRRIGQIVGMDLSQYAQDRIMGLGGGEKGRMTTFQQTGNRLVITFTNVDMLKGILKARGELDLAELLGQTAAGGEVMSLNP